MSRATLQHSNARPLCFLLLLASLLGCGGDASPDEAQDPLAFRYACADGFTFRMEIDGPTVRVFLPEATAALKRVEAASGAKYQGDGVTFWSKGEGALLETPAGTHRDCTQRTAGSAPSD